MLFCVQHVATAIVVKLSNTTSATRSTLRESVARTRAAGTTADHGLRPTYPSRNLQAPPASPTDTPLALAVFPALPFSLHPAFLGRRLADATCFCRFVLSLSSADTADPLHSSSFFFVHLALLPLRKRPQFETQSIQVHRRHRLSSQQQHRRNQPSPSANDKVNRARTAHRLPCCRTANHQFFSECISRLFINTHSFK